MKVGAKLYNKMPSDLQALFEQCPNLSRDEVLECFPETSSGGYPKEGAARSKVSTYGKPNVRGVQRFQGSSGSAARFFKSCPNDDPEDHEASRLFYCGKATKRDRDEGLEGFRKVAASFASGTGLKNNGDGTPRNQEKNICNTHPTVKATALMRYLCRLITPAGGIILDPFTGSGSTGKAAILEGFQFVGIEQDTEYLAIACARIKWAEEQVASQLTLDL